MVNPFIPESLVSRDAEIAQVCELLASDRDFAVTGIPGSGRRTLLRTAAKQVGCRYLELDLLRCRQVSQFLRLLADSLTDTFAEPHELAKIQQWSLNHPLTLDQTLAARARLVWPTSPGQAEWRLFAALLSLPQHLALALDCHIVLVLHNFAHLRSWDRHGEWEAYLCESLQDESRVSHAFVTAAAEPWAIASQLPIVALAPLADADLEPWLVRSLAAAGLEFDPDSQALPLFLRYVQGHIKDAIALAQRIWLDRQAIAPPRDAKLIQAHQVHSSMLALVQDLSVTFETLLLLLPPSQARVLESLALDPTDSPQAKTYIQKHQLSRGGGLQGALNSLEQKGLIYGPQGNYRIALPLLDFWLQQRLC